MTALTRARASSHEMWTYHLFPLAVGFKAYKNAIAVIDLSIGKVKPGAPGPGLFFLGLFAEDMDASSAEKQVNVNLLTERRIEYVTNDVVAPVLPTSIGQLCYMLDDQTATLSPVNASALGRVFDVRPGSPGAVGFERSVSSSSTAGLIGGTATAPAYVANDLIIPANPTSGTIIDIPTTTGASTVTLPAATPDRTTIRFVADGVKNGHTVQYRDAAGAVLLTTALTASKRHQVDVTSLNGKWTANAYVSP